MDSPTTLTNDDDQLKKVNESEDLLDYSQKVYLVKEIGPPPEDPVCDSGIYCYGPLLEAVQMSHIYPDSKTFVDKKLKFPPGKIIKNFQDLLTKQNGAPLSLQQVKSFVEEHFEAEGTELENWLPDDWTPEPEFISQLRKPALKGLARRINRLWKDLSRKIKEEVKENPSLYSIIYVPNGFIVPGGRFREFYYWDTYWIVKALLHCDMAQTVKGIIENFLSMVRTYGIVPNGGRIYYLKRSQPPFLTLMVKEYWDKTHDVQFVRAHLATLETELEFWETRRSIDVQVNGQDHILFRYGTGGTGPRPESYREDVEMGNQFSDPVERESFYFHMKAGAESGWDYSTRWMINKQGENVGDLKDIKTNFIIPVDLNCIIYMNYSCISEFYSVLGDTVKADTYAHKARTLSKAIESVLWNEPEQMWFDFDILNSKQRNHFYPSNLFPLWAECYDVTKRDQIAKSSVKYLKETGAIRCKGGIPTSMEESGQQWDFPNAWPPLQQLLVAGLLKTDDEEARQMALTIARRYTTGTMFSCPDDSEVCNMFEKYNVNSTGKAGGGGEYDVQTGFGWTNGVVIDFMVTFGDELLSEDEDIDDELNMNVELNTHFDVMDGKSTVLRRPSLSSMQHVALVTPTVMLHVTPPEKHELEMSEKNLLHPALEIEEDDDSVPILGKIEKSKNKRKGRKKISSIHGDVLLESSTSTASLEALEKATNLLDDILEQHDEEPENKNIAERKSPEREKILKNNFPHQNKVVEGDEDKVVKESEELVVHFVSNPDKFEDPAKRNFNWKQDEMISIRLKGNDVNVFLLDSFGKEVPVTDVDLELELPARFRSHSRLKSRLRQIIQRLKNLSYNNKDGFNMKCPDSDKSVMYIKDRMRVRDSSGKEFDIEMDLKVEIQPARPEIQQRSDTDPNDEEEHGISNYNRFMCPISMPWRHAFSKKQIESGSSHGTRTSSTDDVFKEGKLSTSSSLNSMEQLKLLEIENNNFDFEADERIWRKSSGPVEEKTPAHKSSLADLFKYTPV